jgi:hypothetical protein
LHVTAQHKEIFPLSSDKNECVVIPDKRNASAKGYFVIVGKTI